MGATILRMTEVVVVGANRPFFAIADHFDGVADPQAGEESTDFLRPFFSQGEIILTTASLVGIAFDSQGRGGVLLEDFRLRREGLLGSLREIPFVELEVDILELF